jgi:hypothetical protein
MKWVKYFGWKTLRQETARRPRRRWKDNIRTDLREIGQVGVDWIHLARDRDEWRLL